MSEDILKRSIRIVNLPQEYDAQPIIDVLKDAGEIVDTKIGTTDMIITYREEEGKQSALMFANFELGNIVLQIEEPDSLEITKNLESKSSFQKLDDIPMTSSNWNFQPGFGAFQDKKETGHEDHSKKRNFEVDQSHVILSSELREEFVHKVDSDTPPANKNVAQNYAATNVIPEEGEEALSTSSKLYENKHKKHDRIDKIEEEVQEEFATEKHKEHKKEHEKKSSSTFNITLESGVKALHSKLQETNVPARETLLKNDKFFNVVNSGFMLVFTASWAFAWLVASF